jgi:sec-independent protein translocase protein TatB
MFDIAWGEFVVIAVVALIVIGPKELPGVLRAIGQWTTKIRRMAAEFQGQFQEALREAEMADLKKEVDNLNDTARGFTSQFDDPLNFKEATKWEPKPDDPKADNAKADDVKPDDAASPTSQPADSLSQPTPSDHPPRHAEEHVEGAEETFPVAAKPPEQAPTAPGGGNGGGTTNAAPAPPVTPPAAQPPSHEGSGQRGSEGGVHS